MTHFGRNGRKYVKEDHPSPYPELPYHLILQHTRPLLSTTLSAYRSFMRKRPHFFPRPGVGYRGELRIGPRTEADRRTPGRRVEGTL